MYTGECATHLYGSSPDSVLSHRVALSACSLLQMCNVIAALYKVINPSKTWDNMLSHAVALSAWSVLQLCIFRTTQTR